MHTSAELIVGAMHCYSCGRGIKSQLTSDVGLAIRFGIVSDPVMNFLRSGHGGGPHASTGARHISMASLQRSSPELDPSKRHLD
jgi:hypothetical protein